MTTRILVLQGDDESPPGSLEVPLRARGATLEIWRPAANEPRPELEGFAAVLALGGRTGPGDDDAWLDTARDLISDVVAREVPYLGLCLGAQLLAQATGGRAGEQVGGDTEIGWVALEVDEHAARADLILRNLRDGQQVFQWHSAAFEPPEEAVVLARTQDAVQAFRVGTRAWGVQFHAEIQMGIAAMWLVKGADQAEAIGVDPEAVRAETAVRLPAASDFADELAARLLALTAATTPERYSPIRSASS